jgi:hypothetical protein
MRRFAIHSGLSLTLALAALVAAGAAEPPPPAVTTTMTFVDPAAPLYQANVGQLKATFKATAAGGGTWNVSSTLKPHALEHGVLVLGPGLPSWVWTQVRQTATATVAATTGQPVQFLASGLAGADGSQLVVACTLTVGADGVVTVQALTLGGGLTGGEQ